MEGLIHHFKLVTEGIRVPAGWICSAVSLRTAYTWSPMAVPGPTGCTTTVTPASPTWAGGGGAEGGMVADVIAAVADIDPVMGGVDRWCRHHAWSRARMSPAPPSEDLMRIHRRPGHAWQLTRV